MRYIRQKLLALALVITLGSLLGMLGFSLWDKVPTPVTPVSWSHNAKWMESPQPSYRLYARHTVNLSSDVQAAWLRVSADNSFILYVNGKQAGRQFPPTNSTSSSSFASFNTLPNQNINDSVPYKFLPENLFIGYPHSWKQTFYVDLSKFVHAGKNVIALEVQKPQNTVSAVVEGYIYTVKGAKPLSLTTGESEWKVATLAENYQRLSWFDPDFPDSSWAEAKWGDVIQEKTFSRLSKNIYDRILEGSWITGNANHKGEFWLDKTWSIPQVQGRAFIRFAGDGEYSLLLNNQLVGAYKSDDQSQLHIFEITDLIKKGDNFLIAKVSEPLLLDSTSSQKRPLGFFLDGWLENRSGEVITTIATDISWANSVKEPSNQLDRQSPEPAIAFKSVNPQEFDSRFEGNAYLLNYPDFLLHSGLWQLLGITLSISAAWLLGWLGFRHRTGLNALTTGAGLILPATLFLIGIGLLKHRYAESEPSILFAQNSTNAIILVSFICIQSLTLFCFFWRKSQYAVPIANIPIELRSQPKNTDAAMPKKWSWISLPPQLLLAGQWIVLAIVIAIGFGLRIYHLDATARDNDENTSLDAIRGILRTGAPFNTSGIWYTRGPLYHYVVALWLRLVGYSSENARLSSAIFGTVTLVVVFFLVRKFTGKVWLAILITAILVIDPWQLSHSRNTRFYQFLQMNVMLSFYFFAKGFIFKEGRNYQHLFFVATTAFLLSQEGCITLLPCFLVGFLCFYRPFSLKEDWSIVLGSMMTMLIYVFNGIFFLFLSLTPPVGISSGTSTPIKLHLGDVTGFIQGLLVGNSRINIIYSLFFLLGLVYFLIKRNGKLVFLFSSVLLFLFSSTFLVSRLSLRYVFPVYPLIVILSVYSAFCILNSLARLLEHEIKSLLPLRAIALCSVILLLATNIEPLRVLSAYQEALERQNQQLFEYVQQHLKPDDVVIANIPAAAAIALDKLDYFLPSQGLLSLDGFYMNQGRMIDRWAGGQVINSSDQINAILEKSNRVWVQLDDYPRPLSPNQMELYDYIRSLGRSVYEPYGVRLRLWQKEDGIIPLNLNQGKDLGNY
jgi:hypothetical protein